MKYVLVDTSIWISFFKGDDSGRALFPLLESNQVCINDLILSEIVPSLRLRKENHLETLLQSIERIELRIVWSQIIEMQTLNLRNGINKVGIPDLIIAQNAIQNDFSLMSLDKHFLMMKESTGLRMYE